MRKLTALFVASTLAMGAANLAHAADTTAAPADSKPMMHHKGKPGMHHDMMFKDLNLTDAQKQQVRDIMKSQRDQMKRPTVEERRATHDIIASDTFDKAKAEAQIAKMEVKNLHRHRRQRRQLGDHRAACRSANPAAGNGIDDGQRVGCGGQYRNAAGQRHCRYPGAGSGGAAGCR